RPQGPLRVAREAVVLPQEGPGLRLRRRRVHARRSEGHVRSAARHLRARPGCRPCPCGRAGPRARCGRRPGARGQRARSADDRRAAARGRRRCAAAADEPDARIVVRVLFGAGGEGQAPMNEDEPGRPRYTLWEMTLYALKLGSIGFGGPVALVGYMYRDLVEHRRWISEADYKEGLTLAQLM